jgi:hypothetical protein
MRTMECDYDNDGERITAPGKFEGEPIFAPYYWGLCLQGFADDDDRGVFKVYFTSAELSNPETKFAARLKSFLGRKRTLHLWEDSQGFVHCS